MEQTVECPYELVEDTPIGDTIVGQIESINKADPGAYYAVISYDPDAVGHEMSELVNMFFGNTSLQPGIRLMSFELPDFMYNDYPGPRFGREGIRGLCGVEHGPILMSAIKPLGKSPKELAEMVYKARSWRLPDHQGRPFSHESGLCSFRRKSAPVRHGAG